MKNGKSKKVKIVRRTMPVEYKLKLSFELQQAEELGGLGVKTEMLLPIRKGAGEKFSKYTKEDVASALRKLADVIEKNDPTALFPDLAAQMKSAGKGKTAGPN